MVDMIANLKPTRKLGLLPLRRRKRLLNSSILQLGLRTTMSGGLTCMKRLNLQ